MKLTNSNVRQTARDLLSLENIAYIKMRTKSPGEYLRHFYNLEYMGANESVDGLWWINDDERVEIPIEKISTRVIDNRYGIHKLRVMWDPKTIIINELAEYDKISHYCTFFANRLYKFSPGVIEECWLTLEKTLQPLIRQKTVLQYLALEPCEDMKVIWRSSVNSQERTAIVQRSLFDE